MVKPDTRKSSDSCWPLRNSQGLTFAQAKELKHAQPDQTRPSPLPEI